jgi:integrase
MPDRYRAQVIIAAYTCIRFGELTELRRKDLVAGVLHIRRGVTWVMNNKSGPIEPVIDKPKTDESGYRDIPLPEFLRPILAEHLLRYAEPGADGSCSPPSREVTCEAERYVRSSAARAASWADRPFRGTNWTAPAVLTGWQSPTSVTTTPGSWKHR